jgi:hypothetical protein
MLLSIQNYELDVSYLKLCSGQQCYFFDIIFLLDSLPTVLFFCQKLIQFSIFPQKATFCTSKYAFGTIFGFKLCTAVRCLFESKILSRMHGDGGD